MCACLYVYVYVYVREHVHKYVCVENSPLIDAGVLVPPYTDGHVGAAPDIGAYERGGVKWVAGCAGLDGCMHI